MITIYEVASRARVSAATVAPVFDGSAFASSSPGARLHAGDAILRRVEESYAALFPSERHTHTPRREGLV